MGAQRARPHGFERVSVAEQARHTRAAGGFDPLPGSGRRALAGAAGWSAGSSALAQLLSLLGSVVVARYLVPDQYGVAAMALVVVQFAAVFSTFGLTPAVVAGRIAEPVALRSAHWLVTAVGLSLTLCIVAIAPWVGRFFAEPRVATVLAVAGLAPLLHSAGMIPSALMQNAGRFDLLARIRVGTQICATALAIGMAIAGYGVWALVVPTLAASLTQSALIVLRAPLRFSLDFDLASLRGHLREGAHVTGSALGDYSFHSADKLIVGRMLGTHQLGLYNFAYMILARTLATLSGSLAAPLLASLSGLRDDLPRFDRNLVRAGCAVARVSFPIGLGAAAVAPALVEVVFGSHWSGATNLVRGFLILGAAQAVGALAGPAWLALGHSRLLFRWAIAANAGSLLVYIAGASLGSAESLLVAFALFSILVLTPASVYLTRRYAGLPLAGLASGLLHVLVDSLVMAAAVCGLGVWLEDAPVPAVLGIQIVCGALVYLGMFRLRRPAELCELLDVLPEAQGQMLRRGLALDRLP